MDELSSRGGYEKHRTWAHILYVMSGICIPVSMTPPIAPMKRFSRPLSVSFPGVAMLSPAPEHPSSFYPYPRCPPIVGGFARRNRLTAGRVNQRARSLDDYGAA